MLVDQAQDYMWIGVLPKSGTSCAHTVIISDFYGSFDLCATNIRVCGWIHCEEAGEEKEKLSIFEGVFLVVWCEFFKNKCKVCFTLHLEFFFIWFAYNLGLLYVTSKNSAWDIQCIITTLSFALYSNCKFLFVREQQQQKQQNHSNFPYFSLVVFFFFLF